MINIFVACFVFTVLHSLNGAFGEEEELVFIRDMDSPTKRSIDSLPDLIPLKVATKDSTFHLMLVRNRLLDNIPFHVVDDAGERELQLDEKSHGFYHDGTKNAVIQVELVVHEGVVKRKYTGSLTHGNKAYELQPVEINDRLERELQDRAEDITGIHLHVLRHADLSNVIKDTEITGRNRRTPNIFKKDNNKNNGQSNSGNNNNDKSEQVDTELPEQTRPGPNLDPSDTPKSKKDKLVDELEELLKDLRKKQTDNRQKRETSGRSKRKTNRHRRSIPEASSKMDQNYKVEVVFLVDETIYTHWLIKFKKDKTETINFIAKLFKHIFNGIYMTFRRISSKESGITITPVLKRIQLNLRPLGYSANYKYTSSGYIDGTAGIQDAIFDNERNQPKNQWVNIDHMMVWTMHKLWETGSPSFGFSPVCKVCDPMFGYSLVMFTGYHSWLTGTHELAHNLGARHDGDANSCPKETYIMSPNELVIDKGTVELPFLLSPCSITEMKGCLSGHRDGVGKTCLLDNPCNGEKQSLSDVAKVPGTWITLEKQCFLFGHSSGNAVYDAACNPGGDSSICGSLKCKLNGKCTQPNAEFTAMPGTPCGKKKWCMWGQCVSKDINQYYDKSGFCKKKRSITTLPTLPSGCEDSNALCEKYAMDFPYEFFKREDMKGLCKATIYKYGLHFDFQNPCFSIRVGEVTCPSNQEKSVRHTQLCDGRSDCPNGEDENQDFCDEMSVTLPFCGDDRKVHCPNDFNKCIDPAEGCDGRRSCTSNNKDDERASWCARLPKQTCGPGSKNCANNPSRCC